MNRIISVSGNLRLEKGVRNTKAQLDAGGNDRKEYDNGGHLIATIFGGSGDLDNLIAQDSHINKSTYKAIENRWKKLLLQGYDVNVDIQLSYTGIDKRPNSMIVNYTISKEKIKKSMIENLSFINEDLRKDGFRYEEEDDLPLYEEYSNPLPYNPEDFIKELK